MASSSSDKLVFFFLACLLFTFSDNIVAGESNKVKLNLYYESLCPFCQDFIADGLVKVFDSDLHTITELKLVPFGNARVSDNLTVTCQHGEEECKLNAIEACAIRTWPDPMFSEPDQPVSSRHSVQEVLAGFDVLSGLEVLELFLLEGSFKAHYWFIRCVETDTKNWESSCFEKYGAEKAIKHCFSGDLSKNLILGYAKETSSLKPEQEYVPWVTVNGKPLYDNYVDFVARVCKAYKGKAPLPKICNSSALSKSPKSKVVKKLQVSYADEASN